MDTTALAPWKKHLTNLDSYLTKAIAHAASRGFNPEVLFSYRLAPDQYALSRQVQATCDAAKSAAARLAGQEPPSHPDTEATLAELRTRIATVLAYLNTFTDADFADAETREIRLPFAPGTVIAGSDYLAELAVPNFYFHLSMAYAILRHAGVPLGKTDFIGSLSLRPA
jgi:hypothetical protein